MQESNYQDVPAFPEASLTTGGASPGGSLAGCQRPASVGCGCIAVTLALGLVLLSSLGDEIRAWQEDLTNQLVEQLRTTVEGSLPESLEDADRERLDSGFDDLASAMLSNTVPVRESWRIQRVLLETLQTAMERTLTIEEVRALISALEAAKSYQPSGEELEGGEREGGEDGPGTRPSQRNVASLAKAGETA